MGTVRIAACLSLGFCFGVAALFCQEDEPGDGKKEEGKTEEEAEPKKEGEEEPQKEEIQQKKSAFVVERERRILALFNASTARFNQGEVVLTYDFGTRFDHLLLDWRPTLEESGKRVRWSVSGEGPTTYTVKNEVRTSVRQHGIVISDFGQWVHKAAFAGQVEVYFKVYNMAQPRDGTVVAPVFVQPRKKRALGANCGLQAVCLSGGVKPAPLKPPLPKGEKSLPLTITHWMGFRYDGKLLQYIKDGKVLGDTSASPKFCDGFDVGQPGIFWNGAVKCYIRAVSIKGRLDPDWIAEALGEKSWKK